MRVFYVKKFGFDFKITESYPAVIAEIISKEKVKSKGITLCHEDDSFDIEYGMFIAMRRAVSAYYGKRIHECRSLINSLINERDDTLETLLYHQKKIEELDVKVYAESMVKA